jgi:hypothetical protein
MVNYDGFQVLDVSLMLEILSLSYWRSGHDCMPGGVLCKICGKAQFPFVDNGKRRLKIKKLTLKP